MDKIIGADSNNQLGKVFALKLDGAGIAEDETGSPPIRFPIVGIGASPGGLASFEVFFQGVPEDKPPDMAFVLVQHLSPDYSSGLADIISRYSKMKVFQVESGMIVHLNCIYIIPPNFEMALVGGKLELYKASPTHSYRTPINFFFHSLAEELGLNCLLKRFS